MHDLRRPQAGGGHLLECECRQTAKHPSVGDALAQWRRLNTKRRAPVRRPEPTAVTPAAPQVVAGVVQFPLAFARGA
ncbi:hypothetical protein J5226_21110 [Lysobacter sp. K5869]|uniref:hypothetical protein n=1 Tax=Lysobacter sp. K5869 TaxID=2820808 RepID=UPI001C0618C9|nr:hypothetical protein [Lysobacter sp. K5869]QWP76067.1 hypothetical protein J5226_21110 [Lysobacter sp. K5869]